MSDETQVNNEEVSPADVYAEVDGNQEAAPEAPQAEQPVNDYAEQFRIIKQQQRELQKEKAKMNSSVESQIKAKLDKIKSDPLNELRNLGLSTEDLVSKLLNAETPKEESQEDIQRRELAELKAWREEQIKNAQIQQQQKLIADFKQEIDTVLTSNADDYELVLNSPNGKDLLWKSIEAHAREYGEVPDIKEVATMVESHLLENAKKLLGLKKLGMTKKVSEQVETSKEGDVDAQQIQEAKKTLTNKMTGRVLPTVERVDSKKASSRPAINSFQQWDQKRLQEVLDKFK